MTEEQNPPINESSKIENAPAFSLAPPKDWAQLSQKEQAKFRNKQIEAITAWLDGIANEDLILEKVPNHFSKESQSDSSRLQVENSGVVDVLLDQRALQIILKICGLTEPKDIEDLKITLRTPVLAHRDFYGRPTGGALIDTSIEAYTSAPDNYLSSPSADILTSTRQAIVPWTEDTVINTIVHELRHFIQKKTGMYQNIEGSFPAEEHDDLNFEQDANTFGDALQPILKRFIQIQNNIPVGANTQPIDRNHPMVKAGLAKPGEALLLRGEDSSLIQLSQTRKNFLANLGALELSDAIGYTNSLKTALNADKIGFGEYRLLLKEALKESEQVNLGLQIYFQGELHSLDNLFSS